MFLGRIATVLACLAVAVASIPLANTAAERIAAGDPRLSLQERYGNHQGFVGAVKFAAVDLVNLRFLLQEDANRIALSAFYSNVLQGR